MSTLKGVVEYCKLEQKTGAKGPFYKAGLKINGQFYNLTGNNPLPDYTGKLVTFEYTEDSYGNKIAPKTFKASESTEPVAHTGGPKTAQKGDAGIKIGHAVTNGVQLAIAVAAKAGVPVTAAQVKKYAIAVLQISHELNADYADIVESFELQGDEEVVAQEAPAAAPVDAQPAPAAPKKAAPKAAPKAAAAAAAPATAEFEDDIPF